MNQPSLDLVRRKVDSRYTLVAVAAKRARQLLDGAPPLIELDPAEAESLKPVSIALRELADDKLQWERTKTGIK